MAIRIVKSTISKNELREIAKDQFGDFVKAVVDIEQGIMAIGGELHADEEVTLNEQEQSSRVNVWGINLYPDKTSDEWIEFDSMINIKPQHNNRSRGVEDASIREKIIAVVNDLVTT